MSHKVWTRGLHIYQAAPPVTFLCSLSPLQTIAQSALFVKSASWVLFKFIGSDISFYSSSQHFPGEMKGIEINELRPV